MINLPMDLLRTFVAIADIGNLTKAGDRLGRSQPAISLQLKRLEELVGAPLFDEGFTDEVPTTKDEPRAGLHWLGEEPLLHPVRLAQPVIAALEPHGSCHFPALTLAALAGLDPVVAMLKRIGRQWHAV